MTADLLKGAAKLGSLMFACMTCELISLTTIDSSMASFLENTAVAWVPVITAVIYHRRPEKIVILCTLLIICGVGLLTLNGAEFRPGRGELICLTGSVCYAFWIIATAKTAHRFDPLSLGIMQFFFLSLYSSIGTVLFETPFIPTRPVEAGYFSAHLYLYDPGLYAAACRATVYNGRKSGPLYSHQSSFRSYFRLFHIG